MGWTSVLAIKTDGTLWGWGDNTQGTLGLGDSSSRSSPVQIGTLTNWNNLTAGFNWAASTTTAGTLYAWGVNNYGQLGIGNRNSYSSPKQVGSLTNWSTVNGGQSFCTSIKTDGTMWGWGINNDGQIGLNNTTYAYSSPKQVGSLTTWVSLYNGYPGDTTIAISTS